MCLCFNIDTADMKSVRPLAGFCMGKLLCLPLYTVTGLIPTLTDPVDVAIMMLGWVWGLLASVSSTLCVMCACWSALSRFLCWQELYAQYKSFSVRWCSFHFINTKFKPLITMSKRFDMAILFRFSIEMFGNISIFEMLYALLLLLVCDIISIIQYKLCYNSNLSLD